MARPKGSPKLGGRQKGTPNKTTVALKEAILQAAALAGKDNSGLVGYLLNQAEANPTAFMSLLGKVLPSTITGDKENPLAVDAKLKSDDGFEALCAALALAARAASSNDKS